MNPAPPRKLARMTEKTKTPGRLEARAALSAGLPVVSRLWFRLIEGTLGSSGLSGGNCIPLFMLGRVPGGLNQAALAERIGVSGPSLIRHIDRLCEMDLVMRTEDPHDRRAKTLLLTRKGKVLAARMEDRLEALREEVFGHLSDADVQAALRVHEAVQAAIDLRLGSGTGKG